MRTDLTRELELARRLAREAGRLILEVYATDFQVHDKGGDEGPVTEADRRANAHIVSALRAAFPHDAVIGEESKDRPDATRFERVWWVDPLDGTRDFVRRNGEFAVQIGLAEEGEARLGVLFQPAVDKLWTGVVGGECVLEANGRSTVLKLGGPAPATRRMVVSRSHKPRRTGRMQELLQVSEVIERGSVGLKCAALAEGEAELYLHPSPRSSRWDACAPEAVLRAAGGRFTDVRGRTYRYDGEEIENSGGLFGCHPALFDEALPLIQQLLDEVPPGVPLAK